MKQLPSQNDVVPAEEADVSRTESQLGLKFPAEYREFLRWNGGAWIKESVSSVEVPDFGKLHMQLFYGVQPKELSKSELALANEELRGRIPPECISIGYDQMGNQVLLVLSGEHSGAVLFWDHEQEGFEAPTDPYHNVSFLAPNLDEFCNLFAGPVA